MPKFLRKPDGAAGYNPDEPLPKLWPSLRLDIITVLVGVVGSFSIFGAAIICAVTGDFFWTVVAFGSFIGNIWLTKHMWNRIRTLVGLFDDVAQTGARIAKLHQIQRIEEAGAHGPDNHKQ